MTATFSPAFLHAVTLHTTGDLDGACAAYHEAVARNVDVASACTNIGVIMDGKGDPEDAIRWHRRALARDPAHAIAHNNLGFSLNAVLRYDEAVAAYTAAISLDSGDYRFFNNRSSSLTSAGRHDEAIADAQRALWLKPDYAEAYSNLGMAYVSAGRFPQSAQAFCVALALNPALALTHKNLGFDLLLHGDYARGWAEYDWRLKDGTSVVRPFTYPLWTGQQLDGDLLIWGEQGVGDEILQAGMLPDLAGYRIVWEADPRLVSLLDRSFPAVKFASRTIVPQDMGPDVKAHLPAASLGGYLRTDVGAFPQRLGGGAGYLKADAGRAAIFREKLNLAPGEKLIGLSWRSTSAATGDKKSTALAAWADLFAVPGVRVVDLQYGDTAAERAAAGLPLVHIDGLDLQGDIDGVAALASICEAVVTVSNTTAHLAGALGLPTLVLVAAGFGKLWYWGAAGDSTPWYPSARVVRRRHGEEWDAPIAAACAWVRQTAPGAKA